MLLFEKNMPNGVISKKFLLAALTALIFAALLDPADSILHLKIPAFSFVMLIWIYRFQLSTRTISADIWALVFGISFLFPFAWTIIGIIDQTAHSGSATFGIPKTFLFLLLVPVFITEDVDVISLIIRFSIFIALLTLSMVMIATFSPLLFLVFYNFSLAKNNAIITTSRDLFGIGSGQFYYKTSPLMVFAFSYYSAYLCASKKKIWGPLSMCLLYGTAILFSGTRANASAALFIIGVFTLLWIRRTWGTMTVVLSATFLMIIMAITVIPKFADVQEESNTVKIGHIHSYLREFESKPSILVWGTGTNTAFYSDGYQDWTTNTEITYLEMIRVFGLPVTLLFVSGLIYIGHCLFIQKNLPAGIAYLAYISICASNPLLLSSTGLLVVCAGWKEAMKKSSNTSLFCLSRFPDYSLLFAAKELNVFQK